MFKRLDDTNARATLMIITHCKSIDALQRFKFCVFDIWVNVDCFFLLKDKNSKL